MFRRKTAQEIDSANSLFFSQKHFKKFKTSLKKEKRNAMF